MLLFDYDYDHNIVSIWVDIGAIPLFIQSGILSELCNSSAQVSLKQNQIRFDRRVSQVSLIAFVLPCLFCSPPAAGWHRSCGASLDNHMISFCSSSGESRWIHHNGMNPFLLKRNKLLLLQIPNFTSKIMIRTSFYSPSGFWQSWDLLTFKLSLFL